VQQEVAKFAKTTHALPLMWPSASFNLEAMKKQIQETGNAKV
jgi:hypothetical protein